METATQETTATVNGANSTPLEDTVNKFKAAVKAFTKLPSAMNYNAMVAAARGYQEMWFKEMKG